MPLPLDRKQSHLRTSRPPLLLVALACAVAAVALAVPALAHKPQSQPSEASHATSVKATAAEQEAAATGVMRRLLGKRASEFTFTIATDIGDCALTRGPKHSTCDTYIVEGKAGRVHVTGTTGVALTAGAYWYLKEVAGCQVTWGNNRTGDQVSLPPSLPPVARKKTTTIVPWRYGWNICTFDYSAVWWDAVRWQREVDWMALHGINLPLAITGQEFIWLRVFSKLGVDLAHLEKWFTGPAFLAWQRMGNIRGFAGPLSDAFLQDQLQLQRGILRQMRSLGMTPVLPCFSGHVPQVVSTVFPNVTLTQSPGWNNFPPQFTDVYFIDPADPLFERLGGLFMQETVALFGASHYYSCDTFNEVDPTSTNHAYLRDAASAVVKSIQAADTDGVWVMQAWLFHSRFWDRDLVRAYLSGVSEENLLILDLNSEDGALAPKYDQYYGKFWVWNMLHNYGGVRGVYGNLSRIATGPLLDLHRANSTMCGIGFTPEAIEQNPVMYEMLTSTFYAQTPIPVVPWLKAYVTQRYGKPSSAAWAAWRFLLSATYSQGGEARSEIEHLPTWSPPDFGWKNGDATGMFEAWQALLLAASEFPDVANNGPFQYDLVDVTRQSMTMFFSDMHRVLVNTFNDFSSQYPAQSPKKAMPLMKAMLEVITTLDELLATNVNYLLGVWTTRATDLAHNASEADLFLYNAKNQITLWGPHAQITDYAAKAWAGLYSTYYHMRWEYFFDTIVEEGLTDFQHELFLQHLLAKEQAWCSNASQRFSPKPSGESAVRIATRLLSSVTGNLQDYTAVRDVTSGNSIGYYNLWTRDVRQLARLCDLAPTCNGFTTSGTLVSNAGTNNYTVPGSVFYFRNPR